MHADGPRAVGPHGKPVEASAGTTASDVGAMRGSSSQYLNPFEFTAVRLTTRGLICRIAAGAAGICTDLRGG